MADFKVTELDPSTNFETLTSWDVVIIGAGPAGLAASLTTAQRERLFEALASRLDSSGKLQLTAGSSRSQHQNREEVIGRLQRVLADALEIPKVRKKRRPSRKSKEARLKEKRAQSEKKASRRWRPE